MSSLSVALRGDAVVRKESRLVVALRGWGLADVEVVGLARIGAAAALSLGANADFVTERDDGHGARADLVIHLVDLPRLVGQRGEALWNAQGPADAMQRAQAEGAAEIALCLGPAAWLPAARSGCWVLASGRGLEEALDILVRAAVLPGPAHGSPGAAKDGAPVAAWLPAQCGRDLTCVLARHRGDDAADLSAQVEGFLQQAVRQAVTMPAMLMVTEPADAPLKLGAMDGLFGAVIPLQRHRLRGAAPRAGGCQSDLLLCFPWPRLQQGAPARRRVSAA